MGQSKSDIAKPIEKFLSGGYEPQTVVKCNMWW